MSGFMRGRTPDLPVRRLAHSLRYNIIMYYNVLPSKALRKSRYYYMLLNIMISYPNIGDNMWDKF